METIHWGRAGLRGVRYGWLPKAARQGGATHTHAHPAVLYPCTALPHPSWSLPPPPPVDTQESSGQAVRAAVGAYSLGPIMGLGRSPQHWVPSQAWSHLSRQLCSPAFLPHPTWLWLAAHLHQGCCNCSWPQQWLHVMLMQWRAGLTAAGWLQHCG